MVRIREKISWVLSDSINLDPTFDITTLKQVGPLWGSWRTWRACQTDNVICHDHAKASDLVQRQFQNQCNLYIPETVNASLDRPIGVKLYAGEFVHDLIRQEEIVAMHLAASTSDIVLLLGWELTALKPESDPLTMHQKRHHRNHVRQAFDNFPNTQWVVVDHHDDVDANLLKHSNVVLDSLSSILELIQH